MEPEPDQLERLLLRTGLALHRWTQRVAAAHGMSATGLDVLRVLVVRAASSQRDLAGELRLTPATLTPVLDALETAGAITRVRDATDRRVVRVSVTASGRERYAVAVAGVHRAVGGLPRPSPQHERMIRNYLLGVLDAVAEE
jgi:DNA-binding MarR family transcriptional regulator